MSHFAFLQAEWPALFESASKAEALALPDPRTSCFYARRSLELVVDWVYKHRSFDQHWRGRPVDSNE